MALLILISVSIAQILSLYEAPTPLFLVILRYRALVEQPPAPIHLCQLLLRPSLNDIDVDGFQRQEAVDMDSLRLAVTTNSSNSLSHGCLVVLARISEQRRKKDGVICVRKISASIEASARATESLIVPTLG